MAMPRFFKKGADFRTWLERNHAKSAELLIGFNKTTSGRGGLTYQEALDEALCFGWIDGVRRSLDQDRYTIRFTPRRPRSYWSQINLARIAVLKRRGLVADAGLEALARRDPSTTAKYSNERADVALARSEEETLKANRAAWAFLSSQAPSYQRVVRHWITSAKRQETRQRRLRQLIEDSVAGRRIAAFVSPRPRAR